MRIKPIKYYTHHLFGKKEDREHLLIRTKSIQESFDYLALMMKKHERLFFVRFGDGEFVTMLKKNHRNYKYNATLDKEIETSFRIKAPNYLVSCPINYPFDEFHAKGIYKRFSWQHEMVELMQSKGFDQEVVFENPCIFQCMAVFRPKLLKKFFEQHVIGEKKMFIGSTAKDVAEKLYGPIAIYVQIPPKHAYESIDDWWPKVVKNLDGIDLVIPSAGSTSNVISVRLWNMGFGKKVIDFGSIVDAVDGKVTRSWIRLQGHKILKVVHTRPKSTLQQKVTHFLKDVKFFFRNQVI